jgi:tRNA A-37 threonylcarbamoyl transferase component Bud32/membrane-associated phospholipid phosphatase
MDTAPARTAVDVEDRARLTPGVRPSRRRRRPTGAPPPLPRTFQVSSAGWLVATLALVALFAVTFAASRHGAALAVIAADDRVVEWFAGLRSPWLTRVTREAALLGSWGSIRTLTWCIFVSLLVFKRFRHLIVYFVLINLTFQLVVLLSAALKRPRPFGVAIEGSWNGYALPSIQVALLAASLVTLLYSLVPEGRWRQAGKWAAVGIVLLVGVARIYLGADAPTDVLLGAALGVTIPLLAFRFITPSGVFPIRYRRGRTAHLEVGGARGVAIRQALTDQLGLVVTEVKPFGLAGSAGSTPVRIAVKGDPDTYLFGKLYAKNHLRSDRSYKFGRELLYGRLEDEKSFNSVRRLVQQEDYALRLLHDAGLPSPQPFGVVELTPEREYLLVTEFFDGAVELGEARVDERVIDDGLEVVRKLWDAGLAHRDIKPANLLVRDGHMFLIDVAFAEVRPSPWRQAVDLANMMLCLALRSDPKLVYARALRLFTVEEITEAFAAARGLTMPSQLRRMIREAGHDLHADFLGLLPERPRPIAIQRWSLRRVGLTVVTLLIAFIVVQQAWGLLLDDEGVSDAPIRSANLACAAHEPLVLMAQSVPTAAMVPCVGALPTGWSLGDVVVGKGRSWFTLDHDRGGLRAITVELTGSCDARGARPQASDQPGTQLFQRVERTSPGAATTRWYAFPGGCITQRLDASTGNRGELLNDASIAMRFITRDTLRTSLRHESGGRLELDEKTAR